MTENYIEKASEEKGELTGDEKPLDEFLSYAENNPTCVQKSEEYLLNAIKHFGTRTVFEQGREKERYCFFDDPYGDGQHAILGNTDELNDFVDELEHRVSDNDESDKIIWFIGPTATGKSELKRCIINGLKGFAETEEGAKYTLEWTLDSVKSDNRMAYGDDAGGGKEYYKSPVNVNPLSFLPEDTRKEFTQENLEGSQVESSLDPFSREALDMVEEKVDDFEEIIDSEFVRAKRYYPDVGNGIGVLHTEDGGDSKQKLVGSWMQGAMQKFAKRGQKNPQAFSYDGVLSQGNGLVSIVEDAGHHSEVLDKMMNVCEEGFVKLDNKIAMDIDTLIVVFSNPDLQSQLEEYSDAGSQDPLRALRRRLDQYEFSYLTTFGIEGILIRQLLQDNNNLYLETENRMEKVSEPLEIHGTEIAPRCIEAAAMYEVISRLSSDSPFNQIEQALLLENGEVENEVGDIINYEDVNKKSLEPNGGGIPVTYTVDKIVELSQAEEFITPEDVIEYMSEGFDEEPIFASPEATSYQSLGIDVNDYIFKQQESDVLDALVGDITVTEDDVREYVDSLLAWEEGNDEDYDAYELKEFETRYLGQGEDKYGSSAVAKPGAVEFRKELISPINKYMWEKRSDDFTVQDVPLAESPPLRPLLQENDWDTVERIFPDANFSQWESPAENTETEEVKQKAVKNMKENQGYSDESAKAVSKRVVEAKNNAGLI